MPSYQPAGTGPSSPVHSTRPSSISSSRRPSISSFRLHSSREVRLPDPEEMDAAFDGPDDDDDEEMGARNGREAETRGLLSGGNTGRPSGEGRVPGDYDFERDYTQPPDAPPPFQPYSSMNPAPGNTNGFISTDAVQRPMPARHFLGGILPSAFLPRQAAPGGGRPVGGGNSGVFANLAARPAVSDTSSSRADGPEYAPEDEQKDGPPSYQAALRDAVPPYWDTTVVLPSSQSPFGPLSSSMSGDEILIDGMPSGNFFGFVWNLIVSASFQFVGFILTYVLHTTHSAKYGSRVGLGITLIQFGFSIRARAEQLIESGQFPAPTGEDAPDTPQSAADAEEIAAENAISAYLGPQAMHWPQPIQDPLLPADAPPTIINNMHEAELYAHAHNETLNQLLGLPSAEEVGRANEWFSFMLMVVGWFLILTSIGGWWRVKRFEAGLRAAQRESEAAQAEAAANRDAAASGVPSSNPVNVDSATSAANVSARPGPTTLAYYTSAFSQALDGARHIQRGFFGMNGQRLGGNAGSRPGRGSGHTRVPTQEGGGDVDADEHELLDAQGFGLEPMAGRGRVSSAAAADDDEDDDDDDYPGAGRAGGRRRRGVGLWGI